MHVLRAHARVRVPLHDDGDHDDRGDRGDRGGGNVSCERGDGDACGVSCHASSCDERDASSCACQSWKS